MDQPDPHEELADNIAQLISSAANEPILARRMEKFLHPRPAELATTSEQADLLKARLERLAERLGASPTLSITVVGQIANQVADEYGATALYELVSYYWRCRHCLVRSHLLFVAVGFMKGHKELYNHSMTDDEYDAVMRSLEEHLWEEIESCYIRLAAYWDRVGQFLDFLFFNIRQFDKEGFTAVIDRIRSNYVSILPDLKCDEAWMRIDSYHRSEQSDGYKWLVQRRNLLVHSLHLHSAEPRPDDPLFTFAFNHLHYKFQTKLRPQDTQSEIDSLHVHFRKIATLFPDVASLAEFALKRGLHFAIHGA